MYPRGTRQLPTNQAVGVDIGQHTIKTILLEFTAEGLAVRHAARMPTPENSLRNGVLVKQRDIAATLRSAFQDCGRPIRSASIAIPTDQVTVRWIDLPRMKADALRAATRFEARKYLPYPVDRAEVVIVPVENTENTPEDRMRCLLAAAPRDVLRSRAEALEMADVDVAAIEMEPLALLRAMTLGQTDQGRIWRGQAMTYVNLGEESSSMSVLQDSNLRFVHAISWGSSRLTQVLMDDLRISAEEAMELKGRPDALLEEDGAFTWMEGDRRQRTEVMRPELDRLRREIARLLNYYRSLFPERSYEGILDRIVLCGGTANLNGVARYFGRALQIDVTTRNPFQSLASRLSSSSFAAIEGKETGYVVAIGLALGQIHACARAEGAHNGGAGGYVWRRKAA